MFLDVVNVEAMYFDLFVFVLFIMFICFTISRYNAYKKNPIRKIKVQSIVFLIITLILGAWLFFSFTYKPKPRPEPQWNNISTYKGGQPGSVD